MKFKQTAMTAACACAVSLSALTVSSNALAANWLMLQGTEPAGSAERAKVWGFIQPEYQYTKNTPIKAGPWKGQNAAPNQIRPDLSTNSGFNVLRARVGVRGNGLPLDSKVNYFFLAEFGNNGVTRPGGGLGNTVLTDASVTLNHIPFARVRFGQFKYPGSEEGLQAIHVFDYINFTNMTDNMLLERFLDYDGTGTTFRPGGNQSDSKTNTDLNGPVGAFRDIGIQIFDTFKTGSWEHGYAAMIGNGNGITRGDNNDDKDVYVYWSSEWVFGGKGPRRQGWKIFAWNHDGKRSITLEKGDDDVTNNELKDFDRNRWGLGTTFRKGKFRAAAEYVAADGMIFTGTDGAALPGARNNANNTTASFNMSPEEKADGYYLDFGFLVIPKIELDIRYDVLNRETETAYNERKFETVTLGAQYFFNKKTRLILNYEFREATAPTPNPNAPLDPNDVLDTFDDRASLQVLAIF